MTHRDTFSGFPVRARVCARTGKTCHEASCVIRGSRREARKGRLSKITLEGRPRGYG